MQHIIRWLPVVCALAACSGSKSNTGTVDSGTPTIDAPTPDAAPADAGPQSVTFAYTPGWQGVTSVAVVGQFGSADDWTTPLVTLTQSGSAFSGTAVLPPGTYTYAFQIVGDADAGTHAATLQHFAIDPTQSAFTPCPSDAGPGIYDPSNQNPCSQITVPQPTAPTLFHVTGSVTTTGGAAGSGYLVVLEREEPSSHHFFANRMTTGADGTYDLPAAMGSYRIQVQNPQFESSTDAALMPTNLDILRREISSAFLLQADTALSVADQAFAGYATFAPVTTAPSLPTTFTFTDHADVKTTLDVYGTSNAGKGASVGDPWFMVASTTGSGSFSGTFTTSQAKETAVAIGERYFWGIEEAHKPDASGLVWTGQSLVFPITWQ